MVGENKTKTLKEIYCTSILFFTVMLMAMIPVTVRMFFGEGPKFLAFQTRTQSTALRLCIAFDLSQEHRIPIWFIFADPRLLNNKMC